MKRISLVAGMTALMLMGAVSAQARPDYSRTPKVPFPLEQPVCADPRAAIHNDHQVSKQGVGSDRCSRNQDSARSAAVAPQWMGPFVWVAVPLAQGPTAPRPSVKLEAESRAE